MTQLSRKAAPLLVGAAEVDFTPVPGLTLLGQMHERIAGRVRDPLTANAIVFRQGRETVALVSVDIGMLDEAFVRATQQAFARQTRLSGARLLLHATHTHVAPTVFDLLTARAEPSFVTRVREAILQATSRAMMGLQPAWLFSGNGSLEHMGWNRRAMFSDGTTRMYGHSGMPGFVGMEGPRDPALGVLCVRDRRDRVVAVLLNFSTHPNCLEGECFYSADLPGAARRVLKLNLGESVVVVYLTGAAGNTAPSVLDPHDPRQPWRGEAGIERSGLYLGGEAVKVIASATRPDPSPVLRLGRAVLRIPIRAWPRRGALTDPHRWVREWKPACAYYDAARNEWPKRLARHSPWPVRIHVVRVGDTAICTNPAELFVEFGLEIRAASPARVTLISELTDGYCGYVPTWKAFGRGGYETWPAPTSQLVPEAGGQIVQVSVRLLGKAFDVGGRPTVRRVLPPA